MASPSVKDQEIPGHINIPPGRSHRPVDYSKWEKFKYDSDVEDEPGSFCPFEGHRGEDDHCSGEESPCMDGSDGSDYANSDADDDMGSRCGNATCPKCLERQRELEREKRLAKSTSHVNSFPSDHTSGRTRTVTNLPNLPKRAARGFDFAKALTGKGKSDLSRRSTKKKPTPELEVLSDDDGSCSDDMPVLIDLPKPAVVDTEIEPASLSIDLLTKQRQDYSKKVEPSEIASTSASTGNTGVENNKGPDSAAAVVPSGSKGKQNVATMPARESSAQSPAQTADDVGPSPNYDEDSTIKKLSQLVESGKLAAIQPLVAEPNRNGGANEFLPGVGNSNVGFGADDDVSPVGAAADDNDKAQQSKREKNQKKRQKRKQKKKEPKATEGNGGYLQPAVEDEDNDDVEADEAGEQGDFEDVTSGTELEITPAEKPSTSAATAQLVVEEVEDDDDDEAPVGNYVSSFAILAEIGEGELPKAAQKPKRERPVASPSASRSPSSIGTTSHAASAPTTSPTNMETSLSSPPSPEVETNNDKDVLPHLMSLTISASENVSQKSAEEVLQELSEAIQSNAVNTLQQAITTATAWLSHGNTNLRSPFTSEIRSRLGDAKYSINRLRSSPYADGQPPPRPRPPYQPHHQGPLGRGAPPPQAGRGVVGAQSAAYPPTFRPYYNQPPQQPYQRYQHHPSAPPNVYFQHPPRPPQTHNPAFPRPAPPRYQHPSAEHHPRPPGPPPYTPHGAAFAPNPSFNQPYQPRPMGGPHGSATDRSHPRPYNPGRGAAYPQQAAAPRLPPPTMQAARPSYLPFNQQARSVPRPAFGGQQYGLVSPSNAVVQAFLGGGQLVEEDDALLCVVCMEANKDTVNLPCGHLEMCYDCALMVKRQHQVCPVCRTRVEDVVRAQFGS